MERKKAMFCITGVGFLLVLTSCLVTTMDTDWKDPEYEGGRIEEILVIGVAQNQTIRRVFEDEFVTKLEAHGVTGLSSYRIIPSTEMLDRSTVESKIKTLNIDAVLVASLVDKKTETQSNITPMHRTDWYGWYSRRYTHLVPAGHYTEYEYEILTIETKVYDTGTGEMIWSALSDTVTGGSIETEIKSFIGTITKSLADNKLI